PHRPARLGRADRHAALPENLLKDDRRRAAAVIDRRAGPVEDHGLQALKSPSHHWLPLQSCHAASAIPKDIVMPAPPAPTNTCAASPIDAVKSGDVGCLA